MFETITVMWLDTGEREIWHGNPGHIREYAIGQNRICTVVSADEFEASEALPFYWGLKPNEWKSNRK